MIPDRQLHKLWMNISVVIGIFSGILVFYAGYSSLKFRILFSYVEISTLWDKHSCSECVMEDFWMKRQAGQPQRPSGILVQWLMRSSRSCCDKFIEQSEEEGRWSPPVSTTSVGTSTIWNGHPITVHPACSLFCHLVPCPSSNLGGCPFPRPCCPAAWTPGLSRRLQPHLHHTPDYTEMVRLTGTKQTRRIATQIHLMVTI